MAAKIETGTNPTLAVISGLMQGLAARKKEEEEKEKQQSQLLRYLLPTMMRERGETERFGRTQAWEREKFGIEQRGESQQNTINMLLSLLGMEQRGEISEAEIAETAKGREQAGEIAGKELAFEKEKETTRAGEKKTELQLQGEQIAATLQGLMNELAIARESIKSKEAMSAADRDLEVRLQGMQNDLALGLKEIDALIRSGEEAGRTTRHRETVDMDAYDQASKVYSNAMLDANFRLDQWKEDTSKADEAILINALEAAESARVLMNNAAAKVGIQPIEVSPLRVEPSIPKRLWFDIDATLEQRTQELPAPAPVPAPAPAPEQEAESEPEATTKPEGYDLLYNNKTFLTEDERKSLIRRGWSQEWVNKLNAAIKAKAK